ncbi:OmpA family protein [Ideonella sp. TBM-1]|uniref:OmpA family protein n=2 Tax=Ideonella livida TaxID=2707176 RepID=A0A7C9PHM5_9BURK|nr:OmpA family protein [Ideonella livida]
MSCLKAPPSAPLISVSARWAARGLCAATALALAACGTTGGGAGQAAACKPLSGSVSRTQGAVVGAAVGAVAGGLVGSQVSDRSSVGARNGALLGAIGGALAGSAYAKHISMTEQADGTVKLNIPGKVMFASNSSDLSPEFRGTLDKVGGVIAEYCGVNARIVGHTDSQGEAAYNQALSQRRAASVQQYLSAVLSGKGAQGRQLAVEGAGESQPVASNLNEDGRAQNRRVEVFIIPPKS